MGDTFGQDSVDLADLRNEHERREPGEEVS
jgi:hypothetical protein